MQIKIFDACFMPALIFEIKAWEYIKKEEMEGIEKIQGETLKVQPCKLKKHR